MKPAISPMDRLHVIFTSSVSAVANVTQHIFHNSLEPVFYYMSTSLEFITFIVTYSNHMPLVCLRDFNLISISGPNPCLHTLWRKESAPLSSTAQLPLLTESHENNVNSGYE